LSCTTPFGGIPVTRAGTAPAVIRPTYDGHLPLFACSATRHISPTSGSAPPAVASRCSSVRRGGAVGRGERGEEFVLAPGEPRGGLVQPGPAGGGGGDPPGPPVRRVGAALDQPGPLQVVEQVGQHGAVEAEAVRQG
jgi:hypothetical protein